MSSLITPEQPERIPNRERGSALLIMLTIIGIGAAFLLVSALNKANQKIERDKITSAALAQAKEALIGYAASVALPGGACGLNCARPGELPCPDNWPQGSANAGSPTSPCNGNAIGRLPWKTLGLPDLRDASGERLWYGVSTNYKNNPRVFPLNSDTTGTISVRDPNGTLIADATSSNGMVAVVISPGAVLIRQGAIVIQDRSAAGYLNPVNYLDIANGEDNQDFINGSSNGFIQGPSKDANDSIILNDTYITISRDDIMRVTEQRVAKEALKVMTIPYPAPADFTDTNCLGQAAIPTLCGSGAGNRGRIPANPASAWTGAAIILNGTASDNWFQQNAWREVIYYTIGTLTLNNPPGPPSSVDNIPLLIMTGAALPTQNRTNNIQKGTEANYLEDENLTPLNDTYTSRPTNAATPFNDKARH